MKRDGSRQAIGDTGALAVAKYTSAGLGLLTTIVAARWLGPADYGVAILSIAHCELLFALGSPNTVNVATHYISALRARAERGQAEAIVKLSGLVDVGMGVLTALVALASVPLVPWLYPHEAIGPLIAVFAVSLPFTGLRGTTTAALTAVGRFRWLAVVTVLDRLIMLGLVVAALWMGHGLWGYVVARAATQVAVAVILTTAATMALDRAGIGRWWKAPLRRIGHLGDELRAFFGWSYLAGVCMGVLGQVPLLLLGRFAGSDSVGFFSIARSIYVVTTYVETSLGQVAYPRLSARSAGPIGEAVARTGRWTVRAGLPTAVAVAGATALLPVLLPFALGDRYTAVVGGSQILMIGAIVSALVFWVQPLYYAHGRVAQWTKSLAVDVSLVIALAALVAPAYGWVGLCWLMAANRSAFRLLMALRIRRAR